jgi:hypothetical protein
MLNSLQITVNMVELNDLETVIRAVYQSPTKPLDEDDFEIHVRGRSQLQMQTETL